MRLRTTYSKALHGNTGASLKALLSPMVVVARRLVGGRGKQSEGQEKAKVYRCLQGCYVIRITCTTAPPNFTFASPLGMCKRSGSACRSHSCLTSLSLLRSCLAYLWAGAQSLAYTYQYIVYTGFNAYTSCDTEYFVRHDKSTDIQSWNP